MFHSGGGVSFIDFCRFRPGVAVNSQFPDPLDYFHYPTSVGLASVAIHRAKMTPKFRVRAPQVGVTAGIGAGWEIGDMCAAH